MHMPYLIWVKILSKKCDIVSPIGVFLGLKRPIISQNRYCSLQEMKMLKITKNIKTLLPKRMENVFLTPAVVWVFWCTLRWNVYNISYFSKSNIWETSKFKKKSFTLREYLMGILSSPMPLEFYLNWKNRSTEKGAPCTFHLAYQLHCTNVTKTWQTDILKYFNLTSWLDQGRNWSSTTRACLKRRLMRLGADSL